MTRVVLWLAAVAAASFAAGAWMADQYRLHEVERGIAKARLGTFWTDVEPFTSSSARSTSWTVGRPN